MIYTVSNCRCKLRCSAREMCVCVSPSHSLCLVSVYINKLQIELTKRLANTHTHTGCKNKWLLRHKSLNQSASSAVLLFPYLPLSFPLCLYFYPLLFLPLCPFFCSSPSAILSASSAISALPIAYFPASLHHPIRPMCLFFCHCGCRFLCYLFREIKVHFRLPTEREREGEGDREADKKLLKVVHQFWLCAH